MPSKRLNPQVPSICQCLLVAPMVALDILEDTLDTQDAQLILVIEDIPLDTGGLTTNAL